MNQWKKMRLGSICTIEKKISKESNLPYVGLEDIESQTGTFLGSLTPKQVASATFQFNQKHILYGRLRPYLNKVLMPEFEGHCSSEIFPLLPSKVVDKKFLFYWLTSNSVVNTINETCTGTRMPRANLNEILKLELHLPSIQEQQQIVKKLDQIFADIERSRSNTKKNIQNTRELFENHLLGICTHKEKEWQYKTVGEICSLFQGLAINQKTKYLLVDKSSLPLLRIKDLKNNTVEQYVAEKGFPENALVRHDDIIYTRTGQIGLVFRGREGVLHNNSFKVVPNEKIDRNYLFWWLQHSDFKEAIIKLASRAAQPDITHALFKVAPILIPPLTYQTESVRKIECSYTLTKNLEKNYRRKLELLDELKKNILQKAFTGELISTKDCEVA